MGVDLGVYRYPAGVYLKKGDLMPLTDIAIRNAKITEKAYKIYDGGGLFIEITPSGGRLWKLKYRYAGKEKLLSLGKYPVVSLAAARKRREDAKTKLSEGVDPSEVKRKEKQLRVVLSSDTFEAVARDWFERHLSKKAVTTRAKVVSRMERFVLPYLGSRPVADITAPEVLTVSRRVEKNGSLDVAHRVQQEIGQIMRYAIQIGRAVSDPTQSLRGALPPVKQTHFAAPTDEPARVGELLRMMDSFTGSAQVAAAIKLLPMLFCRPGELRMMKWADIDLDTAEWRYTASKTNTAHLVPLTLQAVAILKDLQPLTGHLLGGYVFTGGRSSMRPMSDAAINAAYRRLGIDTRNELTGHGWRAVARTMLHERLGFEPNVIERQLAHAVKDVNGTAYNRTRFIDERRTMMQSWADYLDKLKVGAKVVRIKRKAA
jgi:integrase